MAIETDEMALENAKRIGAFEDDGKQVSVNAERKVYSIFFVYMRLNRDGTFAAYRYYFKGTDVPIDPSPDANIPHSLGFYARDMAIYARPSSPNDGKYEYHGSELEGFDFPQRYSYCIFFMDDTHWKFLEDQQGRPVITFNDKKNGKPYHKHQHAFGKPQLLNLPMAISGSNDTDVRQAAVMINRMRNKQNIELKAGENESYNFDLWMRVRYPNSTNGLTLIIDPGGNNLGPPKDP
jgi:hypothetical protein